DLCVERFDDGAPRRIGRLWIVALEISGERLFLLPVGGERRAESPLSVAPIETSFRQHTQRALERRHRFTRFALIKERPTDQLFRAPAHDLRERFARDNWKVGRGTNVNGTLADQTQFIG